MRILIEYKIGVWNIRGMNTSEKQKEVVNLIRSEQLNECNKGCIIVVGWDADETNIQVIHKTSQSIFCVISATKFQCKCFYTFVYAANDGIDRRGLWHELVSNFRYVYGKPWCIAGDMNVTLHPNEHSCGSSAMTSDMVDFQDCLNKFEVEDICRSGLHFTWTKNLHKTKAGNMTGILKKLDKVMTNEEFIKQFHQAHAKFLPYDIENYENLFQRRISEEDAQRMVADITDAEIKSDLFDIDDSKAPGPNGFTSAFFKKAWEIIGDHVCKAVKEFFVSGKML
ncbi:RNA-directed DNA polymerase, eukaryota, reverse transcriptase zinc-binding domain protein [Tanacetum coccineum]